MGTVDVSFKGPRTDISPWYDNWPWKKSKPC